MDFAHYIGGEWVGDSDVTTNTSPANRDDVIGTYARGDAARVDQAVSAALAAQPGWAAASPQLRHDVLERAGALSVEREGGLGRLLAREEGKTIARPCAPRRYSSSSPERRFATPAMPRLRSAPESM